MTRPSAETLNAILADGGRVQVSTYLRATLYGKRHAGFFFESASGNLYVRHGRSSCCLSFGERLLVAIRTEARRPR